MEWMKGLYSLLVLKVGTQHTRFITRGNVTRGDHEKVAYQADDGGVHLSEQMNNKVGLEIYL